MKLQEIREIARRNRIEPKGLTKMELIRGIQREEHNFPCFGTAVNGECDQAPCLWREDCFSAAHGVMRIEH